MRMPKTAAGATGRHASGTPATAAGGAGNPGNETAAHGNETAAPGTDAAVPGNEAAAAGNEAAAPGTDAVAPRNETAAPGAVTPGTAATAAGPGARQRNRRARISRAPSLPAGSWPAATLRVLRRHWLAAALLLAGLILRMLTQIAYRPALLYIDSVKYLYNAWPGTDPVGYKVPLKFILLVRQPVHRDRQSSTCSAWPWRRRCTWSCCAAAAPRWLAALAIAPVLLDAYQLQMEQTIMPDVWFEALIVAGLAAAALAAATGPPDCHRRRADPGRLGHVPAGRRDPGAARRRLCGDHGQRLAGPGRSCRRPVRGLRPADPRPTAASPSRKTGISSSLTPAPASSTGGWRRTPTARR